MLKQNCHHMPEWNCQWISSGGHPARHGVHTDIGAPDAGCAREEDQHRSVVVQC